MTVRRGALLLNYAELSHLFSSIPKPRGKKAKDTKKPVKVPAEPQTTVGQSHVDLFSVGLVA